MVEKIDLDVYYKGKNIEALSAVFFDGIGLNVDSILKNSDLYEREGKNPHGFCTDIDKQGDVRILCNIKDNRKWMEVQLHELGHAVYFKYHDRDVPFLLRGPAHIFTTEGIAMLFGRLSGNALWMQENLGLSDQQRKEIETVASEHLKLGQLIFAKWVMVMYNFEKQMYADPDQDLNKLWWDMVEKYQQVKRPEGRDRPDWAAKIHFVIAPCYYHNYLLGELFASQVNHHMAKTIPAMKTDKGVSYVGKKDVGAYLQKNIFEPGAVYHYNEMMKKATGEPMDPKYFVDDFVH
jgi:peptidyl-dipeptidase A